MAVACYPTYLEADYSNPKQWIGSVSTRRTKVLTTAAGKSSAKVPLRSQSPPMATTAVRVDRRMRIGEPQVTPFRWRWSRSDRCLGHCANQHVDMERRQGAWAKQCLAKYIEGEPVLCGRAARTRAQAALAKLMLLPYDVEDPLIPIAEPAGAIYYTADEAVMGEPPFLLETFNPGIDSPASISVYPVGRSVPGDTTMEWYVTSQSGSHQKIMHTAHGVKNPGFLMVIVPRADANAPLALSVERLDGDVPGVVVTWATGRQIVRVPLTGQA